MLRTSSHRLLMLRSHSSSRPRVVVLPDRVGPSLWWMVSVSLAWLLVMSGMARGGTIFVDNRLGNDRYDGLMAAPEGDRSGPVQTLAAAAHRVRPGDSIVIANHGRTYYGSLSLVGARHSGAGNRPFYVYGNGATISGAKPIATGAWQHVRDDIWRITPVRKTFYQLVLDGVAVTEAGCDAADTTLPSIPAGEWCAWRNVLYYHAPAAVNPNTLNLALADEQVGITLLDVQNVVIRDVRLQHYRLDGINAHDRCRDVVLENVTLEANGRAGLAVGGTSQVVVRGSTLQGNRVASALITELGEANLENSTYDIKPTLAE